MAVLGHSGSHAPQLIHSSVILMAIAYVFDNFAAKIRHWRLSTKNKNQGQRFKMMTLQHKIEAFAQLGNKINGLSGMELNSLTDNVRNENPWFTPESTTMALQ